MAVIHSNIPSVTALEDNAVIGIITNLYLNVHQNIKYKM